MTKDTHNWEEEFDKKFMRRIGGVLMWNPERDFPHNSEIKAFIKQAYQAGQEDEEQIVKAELEKILEQGHGGGNWRRLIMEAIEKL